MPWAPGQSGNRSGRPRGFAGVARLIMQATRDGADLVEWALAVWRDPERNHAERAAAHAWLSDRGLGRAIAIHELDVAVTREAAWSEPHGFREMSADQRLAAIDAWRGRMLAGGSE